MQQDSAIWTTSQLMSKKDYEINYYKDKDFKTVNLHSHDFYELYFFIRGNASYLIENGHYNLQAGDILLISPQNLHQLDIFDSRETYERIVLWLSPKYVKKLSTTKTDLAKCFKLCNKNKDFLIRDIVLSERARSMLSNLYDIQKDNEYGVDVWAETLIKELLLLLSNYKLKHLDSSDKNKKSHPTVTKAISYIEDNINSDLTLDKIASSLYVSKFYLSRLFKEETNSTLHQYILKKRLILSKQLIEQGQSIVNVYSKCGFIDYSHFFRAFKLEYGITPKQYYNLIKQ